MHSYRSLSRADQKKAVPRPDGRIVRGHMIRLGDVYGAQTTLTHNTCFIPHAIRVTSLLPSCETRPHAQIRSLFPGLTQRLLEGKAGIMTLVSPSLNLQTSDEDAPLSSLLLELSEQLQLCSDHSELFISYARRAINYSTYRLK